MINPRSRYPRKHFFWVKLLGSGSCLLLAALYGYTDKAIFIIASAAIGALTVYNLDERRY